MKSLALLLSIGLFLLASCTKVKQNRLPDLESGTVVDSLASLKAWVEQVAVEKRDSIRRVDSLISIGQVVDTNSLFRKKNMMISLVEVNDHYFPNVTCYKDPNGKPIFDLAFAFAANLNIDPGTGKAIVSYNPQWQAMLRNGTFTTVMNSGIPVGLSLLGNHDAAGWSNFANLADATDFAQKVAIEVRKYGFKAVLSDDEYSNGVGNATSYIMVMSEIKRLLPDIFLCYYQIGGGSGTYNGKQLGDIADANFEAFYTGRPNFGSMGFPNNKCFCSLQEGGGNATSANSYVQQGARGVFFYNTSGLASAPSYYSSFAAQLKGTTVSVAPGCLNPTQADFINGR